MNRSAGPNICRVAAAAVAAVLLSLSRVFAVRKVLYARTYRHMCLVRIRVLSKIAPGARADPRQLLRDTRHGRRPSRRRRTRTPEICSSATATVPRTPTAMFSCKSRSACGRAATQYSDSDEDSSYGFKTAGHRYRTRAAAGRRSSSTPPLSDDEDYHIYGNVTFGYKPILKTRLSSAASSIRRRSPAVKRTVSFSGVESPVVVRRGQAAAAAVRPPPPCYSVAVRRASSFSTTRRNAAAEIMMARRRRMPLPDENARPLPPCNTTRVVVDVHRKSDLTDTTSPSPSSDVLRRPAPLSVRTDTKRNSV